MRRRGGREKEKDGIESGEGGEREREIKGGGGEERERESLVGLSIGHGLS